MCSFITAAWPSALLPSEAEDCECDLLCSDLFPQREGKNEQVFYKGRQNDCSRLKSRIEIRTVSICIRISLFQK